MPRDRDAALRLAAAVTDWPALLEETAVQGVDGLVFWQLQQWGHGAPPSIRPEVERRALFARLKHRRDEAVLDEVLRALGAAGIRAAPIKGIVLAERLYPAPELRPSSDVDVVVARADAERALAVLEALGFGDALPPGERLRRDASGATEANYELRRPHAPLVELHFRLFIGFGAVMDADEALARAVPYRTRLGAGTFVLAPEDELLYLAVHAAGSWFSRAAWLHDLKLLLAKHPALDGALVAARARALGFERALRYAFETLERRLGVAPPRGLSVARSVRSRLASGILSATATWPADSTRARLAHKAFRVVLSDRLRALRSG